MSAPRLKPFFSILAASAALAAVPRVGAAAEPTPSEISVARRLFDEGKAAEDAGRWREAIEKFHKATAIKDTPGMRYHLAKCEEESGALVEALVELDRATELIEHGNKAPDVEKLLPEARERVRSKLSQVTLQLPNGVSQITVELDDKPVSSSVLGMPLPLNPGAHRLRASAPGRKPFSVELRLETGQTEQVIIDLPIDTTPSSAASATSARPSRSDDSAVSGRTVALVAEASLFAAAITTGIVFTIKRSAAADRYEDANSLILAQIEDPSQLDSACRADLPGCNDLSEAQDERSSAGKVATVAFVTAGASAAAFGLTYWLWPHGSPPVRVTAGAAPDRFGLSVSGRF